MSGGIGERVLVVGSTGAGKTVLAGELAARLGAPHVELDALHFAENWVEVPDVVFAERTAAATEGDAWVLDGNYSAVTRDLAWDRALSVVWLDYPFVVSGWRLLRRTVLRATRRQELWHGNRETFRKSFASRDSILLWFLRTFRRRRRQYEAAMADPANAHLSFVRLRSPREAELWLAGIPDRREGARD